MSHTIGVGCHKVWNLNLDSITQKLCDLGQAIYLSEPCFYSVKMSNTSCLKHAR